MLSNSWRSAASVLMPIGISCTVWGELSSKGGLREDEEHERHARSAPGKIIVPRASGIKLFPRLRQNSPVQSAAVQHSPHPAGVNRSAPEVISAAGPAQADSRGSLGRRTIATRPEQLLHGQE